MTSTRYSNDRHSYSPDANGGGAIYPFHNPITLPWPQGPIEYFLRPRVISVEHFFGLDLGQVHDPSALAGLEVSETIIGRSLVTYEPITVTRSSFRHLERLPLGLDYPSIVEH